MPPQRDWRGRFARVASPPNLKKCVRSTSFLSSGAPRAVPLSIRPAITTSSTSGACQQPTYQLVSIQQSGNPSPSTSTQSARLVSVLVPHVHPKASNSTSGPSVAVPSQSSRHQSRLTSVRNPFSVANTSADSNATGLPSSQTSNTEMFAPGMSWVTPINCQSFTIEPTFKAMLKVDTDVEFDGSISLENSETYTL